MCAHMHICTHPKIMYTLSILVTKFSIGYSRMLFAEKPFKSLEEIIKSVEFQEQK